jgi:hypothetical protein
VGTLAASDPRPTWRSRKAPLVPPGLVLGISHCLEALATTLSQADLYQTSIKGTEAL